MTQRLGAMICQKDPTRVQREASLLLSHPAWMTWMAQAMMMKRWFGLLSRSKRFLFVVEGGPFHEWCQVIEPIILQGALELFHTHTHVNCLSNCFSFAFHKVRLCLLSQNWLNTSILSMSWLLHRFVSVIPAVFFWYDLTAITWICQAPHVMVEKYKLPKVGGVLWVIHDGEL